jgi:uncharacterized membrane protein YdbT with pleckstrin-like domain
MEVTKKKEQEESGQEGKKAKIDPAIIEELLKGEKVIFRTGMHWMVLLAPLFLSVVSILFFGIPSLVFLVQGKISEGGFSFFLGGLLILPAFIGVLNLVNTHVAITNRRILCKTGILRKRSIELLLEKIEGIQVARGLLGQMFDYGTIRIAGAGLGNAENFNGIKSPLVFRKYVNEQIEACTATK